MGVTITMSNDPPFIQLLRPLLGLIIEDDNLRSNVEETARIYFDDENASTTVNLIPAIIILGLLLLPASSSPASQSCRALASTALSVERAASRREDTLPVRGDMTAMTPTPGTSSCPR